MLTIIFAACAWQAQRDHERVLFAAVAVACLCAGA